MTKKHYTMLYNSLNNQTHYLMYEVCDWNDQYYRVYRDGLLYTVMGLVEFDNPICNETRISQEEYDRQILLKELEQ